MRNKIFFVSFFLLFLFIVPAAAETPTFTTISPSTGSTAGGTPVIIIGTNLIGATNSVTSLYNVSVGGTVLTNMTVVSATKIIGSTRAGTGLADVVITTPGGTATEGTGVFTYVDPPTFTTIMPSTGPLAGGTWVNITGTNFIGATRVTFGGTAGTGLSIENETSVIVKTPARTAGLVTVAVITPNGTATGASKYTYISLPTVTSVSQPTGPIAGGTWVNITGMNFIGATGVTFGGTTATSFSIENLTLIRALTPVHAAGRVTVAVATPNGTASGTNRYTYVALPTVTSISPLTGPLAGGTPVTIIGTNLIGPMDSATSQYNVSIGGTTLTNMTVVSATKIIGSTQTGTAGPVNVIVITPNGTVTRTNAYTYAAPPTFTTISPTSGSLTGGTPVIIIGTNLIGATNSATSLYNVSIGGTALTNMTVVSATKIIGSTRVGTAGLVDVVITTPNGTATEGTGVFTYVDPPTFTGIAPETGPLAGGTWVNITGTNFIGATRVTFGGTAGTGLSIENETAVIVKTPARTAGLVTVAVITPNGTATGASKYTYISLPTVTRVSQPTGPIAGGTGVNITGTNFIGATGVTFGGMSVTSFSLENGTSIIAIVPVHAAGLVTVNVVTPNGTAIGASKYTYVALPTVTSITPSTGPLAGGTPVTIIGTNLIGPTDSETSLSNVSIGGTTLTNMTVVSATKIIGSTQTGTAGPVNVIVSTPNGTVTRTNAYTYAAPPTFTSISPTSGSLTGGTPVIIIGTNLIGATNSATSLYNVSIGGTALTNMTVVSATKIIGSTRVGTAGLVDVVITTPNGTATEGTGVFTYVDPPTFTTIMPSTGPLAGGTWVNITGTNFIGATRVTFGGTAGTGLSRENETAVIVKTPAHVAGLVYVNVTTPNGTATGASKYTYISLPTVTSVSPPMGPIAGGAAVMIIGTDLTGTTGVTFSGTAGTSVTNVNATAVTAMTPAHTAGVVSVMVTTPNGTVTKANAYTYAGVPTFTSITPPTGPKDGGTVVTIIGTGLSGTTGVTFSGTAGTSVTNVNATAVTVTTPAGSVGPVDVVVTTSGGTVTKTNAYTYATGSTFTSISPSIGPKAGGTPVIIIGMNLIGAKNSATSRYNVSIGGIVLTNMTVVSATKIIGSTRAGTAGLVDVVVTTPNGTSTGMGAYTYAADPKFKRITPEIGPTTGGTVVTIIGTDLTGTTGISFDGTAGTGVTNINATAVMVTTPAHVAESVDIMVTTPGGTATKHNAYDYVVVTIPVAAFSGSPTNGTAPLTVEFTDVSINSPTNWDWDFGDGKTSNHKNVTHNYRSAGNYTVSLVAMNSAGSNSTVKTGYINVTAEATTKAPVAKFSANRTEGDKPLAVRFTDASKNIPTSWDWDFGDSGSSTDQNPIHQYTTAGTYTVKLVVTNGAGSNQEIKTGYITVIAPVVVNNTFALTGVETTTTGSVQNVTIDTTLANVTTSGNIITFNETTHWASMAITLTETPDTNPTTVKGKVKSVRSKTKPVSAPVTSAGTPTVQIQLNLDRIPASTAAITQTITKDPDASAQASFTLASTTAGKQIDNIAYTLNVAKTNISNAGDGGIIQSANLTMSASSEWVTANGGPGHIVVFRCADDGTTQILTPFQTDTDLGGNYSFMFLSPNGLSTFSLAAISSITSDSGGTTSSGTTSSGTSGSGISNSDITGSGFTSSSDSADPGRSGSSSISSPGAAAGQTLTFAINQQVTTSTPGAIITVAITPSKSLGPVDLIVADVKTIDTSGLAGRHIAGISAIEPVGVNPSSISQSAITFAVSGSWLNQNGVNPGDIVLMRDHDGQWSELPTTFEHSNGDIHYYISNTPGFSYFAISDRLPIPTAKATSQAVVSTAGKIQPSSPPVTVTAITTPVQTKRAPEVGGGTPELSPASIPSIIPDPASILLAFGIILICAAGAIYLYVRKIPQKKPHEMPHKTRILIVDDEPQVLEVFSLILEMEGYDTITASCGKECLSLLTDKKNSPDTILLDIMMYPMDGWETLESIKKDPELRKIPVLMLTGKQLLPEEAKQYGICIEDYLLKPVIPHELINAIEYVLNRKKTIDAEIQNAIHAGHDKTIVCEYAKLARRVDVDRKLMKIIKKPYIKMGRSEREIIQTIEDLADGMLRREENLIQLRQKIFVSLIVLSAPNPKNKN